MVFSFFLLHLSYFSLFCLLMLPYYVVNKVEYIIKKTLVGIMLSRRGVRACVRALERVCTVNTADVKRFTLVH